MWDNLIEEIRQRLANNLMPGGYHKPVSRLFKTVVLNQQEDTRRSPDNRNDWDHYRYAIWSKALNGADTGDKFEDYFQESAYKPTQAKDTSSVYYTIKRNPKMSAGNLADLDMIMGNYTIGKGSDENGNYYSMYDVWDINPAGSNKKDFTGITKPVELYDRVYEGDPAYELISGYYNKFQKTKNGNVSTGEKIVKRSGGRLNYLKYFK